MGYDSRPYGERAETVAIVSGTLVPLGYQQLTNLAASTALTPPVGARIALVHPESQNVRWRDDGTAPSATVGMRLPVGAELRYTGNLAAIRFIEETASAKINVSYYG